MDKMEVLKVLIADKRVDLNAAKADGMTGLMVAAREGFHKLCEALLATPKSRGLASDAVDAAGNTAFHYACMSKKGRMPVLDAFLHADRPKRVGVNRPNNLGLTALAAACAAGNVNVAEDLLHHVDLLDLRVPDREGDTAFHHVCRGGSLALARAFFRHPGSFDPEARNNAGQTPADVATSEVVRMLISREVMVIRANPPSLEVPASRLHFDRNNANMLGEGGQARVYRGLFVEQIGEDSFKETIVAVKCPRQEIDDPAVMRTFEKEIKMWALVGRNHRNVLPLLGFCTQPFAIICPIVEGTNLQLYLWENRDSPRYWSIALRLLLGVAEGMQYIHDSHVVHGDLKPPNVLVDVRAKGGPIPLIADFGMSRVRLEHSVTHGNENNVMPEGTLPFMAPELLDLVFDRTLPPRARKKADVYSFGMVCFMAATRGWEPYHGDIGPGKKFRETYELIKNVTQGYRPDIPPHTPVALSALMKKCWAREPEKRPDFAQIVQDLKRQIEDFE
ncbi:kinase-like domain-containing protein [Hyaloraphidium curvatum]|nr:kinase-like domain-containing protein [Hyaloraphidium curvatum]